MSEKRNHSSSDDVQPDKDELSSQANDELAVMEHAAAFDDPIALEHDALAASAEEDRANERRLRAISVLRRGFAQSPELGRGLRLTVLFAIISAQQLRPRRSRTCRQKNSNWWRMLPF